jgi:CubicO group peptidase (beta-lactamase class C family)
MRVRRPKLCAALAGAALLQAPAAAQGKAEPFERRIASFTDALARDPSAPPAFAVMVVQADRILLSRVKGHRDLRTGAPLTLDTPMYTASVTKSHVGLIAAQLDAAGALPLTASFADVWPGLVLASGQDAARVTARSLLSHTSGVEAPAIQWRYSDTGEYVSSDVPRLLPRFATKANRAYDYGNVGPVMYTAMAEARTGKSWRDLLQDYVARPLGLTRTSARLEDFAPAELAYCNARMSGAWVPVAPKPTALLDAGGGIYSSPRDAAKYLLAFTSEGRSAKGAIKPGVLRRTWQQEAVQDRDFQGFRRNGYGLGWDLSLYGNHKVVSRSGGSAGCRTLIAFVPELRLGVVAFSLSDVGGNGFNAAVVQQAIDFWSRDPQADAKAAARLRSYSSAAATGIREADAQAPVPANRLVRDAASYVGWYEAEGFGRIAISSHPDGLEAQAGVLRLLLAPAQGDRFRAYNAAVPGEPWDLAFSRGASGAPEGFTVEGAEFKRVKTK